MKIGSFQAKGIFKFIYTMQHFLKFRVDVDRRRSHLVQSERIPEVSCDDVTALANIRLTSPVCYRKMFVKPH